MVLSHSIASDGTHIFHNSIAKKYLFLNGNTGIEVSDSLPTIYAKTNIGSSTAAISCILGVIKLKINKYVIVVDKHSISGSITGKKIAKVESFRILPLNNDSISKKSSEENHYLDLLSQHLTNATLYFSVDNSYDLTNSLQKQYVNSNQDSPLTYDKRFWWNYYISEELLSNQATDFVTPVIYGYFKSHSTIFKGSQSLEFALITRRSNKRAGTRYFRRGIDLEGNVANFNETEQVFTSNDGQLFSFLQTRGSVPVYWAEINNLKYKPNLVISSQPALDATAKHFEEQVDLYGDNYLVNLVNQKGYELPVKEGYESAVENLPPHLNEKVKYIYFDFHHECSKMRWDRVKLLIDHLVKLGFTSDNYFHYDIKNGQILSVQDKVVRTNCMDCLDRTNVVQSTLARWVLQNQLSKTGYLPANNMTPWEILDPQFNLFFQSFWADNADAVSFAYSGTGALKTDYTRTGKRTKVGALNDLNNSIVRYYKNNYTDGARQDSYDLFLGIFKPHQDAVNTPFIDKRPPYIQLLPYLMGTSLLVFLAILWYPRGSVLNWKNLLVISGCILFNIKSLLYIHTEGYQFVNWPKLYQLDYLKKSDVFDAEGKFVGIKYEEQDNFKTIGKKKN
ncbi:hypothetical protein HYPBUDRAFT_153547 [Hyphopichia burtonii NRRL Y-1933]|uniref:SAC domain-containing protein n=2 Tax=Dikarya TaxID=451864 RepID=A0A1E4RFC6_9ASCO|nr:hypothetical protein HYPBUDRAFT_153547 [Hyphopichia burtonii NRRL Y-1933]ODV65974.1 hypothetical protein HYPBUDRAFT_153547 [Hyphopichia burtonii NRRL Y-1933]